MDVPFDIGAIESVPVYEPTDDPVPPAGNGALSVAAASTGIVELSPQRSEDRHQRTL